MPALFWRERGTRLIVAEVVPEHGQAVANQLIREMPLDEIFGFPQTPAH